jgi:hypothetical protein
MCCQQRLPERFRFGNEKWVSGIAKRRNLGQPGQMRVISLFRDCHRAWFGIDYDNDFRGDIFLGRP